MATTHTAFDTEGDNREFSSDLPTEIEGVLVGSAEVGDLLEGDTYGSPYQGVGPVVWWVVTETAPSDVRLGDNESWFLARRNSR